MFFRPLALPLMLAAGLLLAACGGETPGEGTPIPTVPDNSQAPTGGLLVFEEWNGAARQLQRLDLVSGEIVPIFPGLNAGMPDVSPRGTLLVTRLGEAAPTLLRAPLAGGTTVPILDEDYGMQEGRWSPDGSMIAYIRSGRGSLDLAVIGVDGTLIGELDDADPANPTQEHDPAWSPDGTRIAYTSGTGSAPEIRILDLASGATTLVAARARQADWSPDGTALVYVQLGTGIANLVVHTLATGERRLLALPGVELTPRWSPDGEWLAFASDMQANVDLYVMKRDGTELRRVARGTGAESYPVWVAAP